MEGYKPVKQENEPTPKNRVLELVDKKYLDHQIEAADKSKNPKRYKMLITKRAIFEGLLLENLANETYVDEPRPPDFLQDTRFRERVGRVSKERLIRVIELNKMRFEEELGTLQPRTDEYMSAVEYIDAADDLILELER